MPIIFIPVDEVTEPIYSFLLYLSSLLEEPLISIPIVIYFIIFLFSKMLDLKRYIIYGNNLEKYKEEQLKPKKDKITLKQMIMRFIGFDHFKEKEDK